VTVARDRACIVESKGSLRFTELKECFPKILEGLEQGLTVVIDEFQRLPERYWDALSVKAGSPGRLIACGSSMGIVKEVFSRNSPLLGLLMPFHVDIASPEDAITSLLAALKPGDAILWATLVRDPWILALISPEGDPAESMVREARRLVPVALSLVGEVFTDEERQLTRLYEAVLKLLARRVWSTYALAQKLYEAQLLSAPNPGIVAGILNQLTLMGLVEGIPLWRTRRARKYYKLRSPITSLLLRMSELVEEHGLEPSKNAVRSDICLELQFMLGELLAKHHSLKRAYTILPNGKGDIDAVLLSKSGQPVIAYEIKVGAITKGEARKAVSRIKEYGIPKAGLVSLKERPPEGVADEVMGPHEIIELAKKLRQAQHASTT